MIPEEQIALCTERWLSATESLHCESSSRENWKSSTLYFLAKASLAQLVIAKSQHLPELF